MIYVLDTDILTLLAHKDSPEAPRIRRRIAQLPTDDGVVTTVVTYEEQMRGWITAIARIKPNKSQVLTYDRLLANLALFRGLTILRYDDLAETRFEQLRSERIRIGTMDLKIAAITLTTNATLITRNVADFRQIPGLSIENWATDQDETE